MPDDKTVVVLDNYERGAVLSALSNERNALIARGKSTDTIDEALVKVAEAKRKSKRGRDEAR